jgi:hypothetical protein
VTAPHLAAGHTIAGKYTLSSLLAFTREVASYAARDAQGQDVVVKLYDPAIAQRADVMAKLDRARQVVTALPADCIVHVVDSGYDSSTAAPYSVTPQLIQPSLAKLVSTGALSLSVVGKIMAGVARSLAAAQQYHLFHHGLKPSNIFVGPAPDYAVQLMDFGVSVVRGTSPTHEAYAACAPWWAPEQLQASEQGGAATDVFAAALVAFFSLTGQSYWRSCQQLPPDLGAWQQELLGPRTPASLRAQEVGTPLNAALDAVFLRCLSVNPGERAAQIDELVQALGALSSSSSDDQVAKTMALPEQYDQAAFEQAIAGAQMDQPAAGQQAQAQAPHSAQQGYPAAGQAAYPADGTPHPGAAADMAGGHVTPGLPDFPPQPAKKPNKALLPVIIVIVMTLLVGGALAAYFVMRSPSSGADDDAKARAAASASAEPGAGGAAPATSVADASGGAIASGGASGGTRAEPAAGGAAPEGGGGAPPDEDVRVTIKCIPKCQTIEVDGKKIKRDEDGSFDLAPGKHKIVLRRRGYVSAKLVVDLEAGEPYDKRVPLVRIRRSKPPPSCGQFLNRCP